MIHDTFKLEGDYSYIGKIFNNLIDYTFIEEPEYQKIIKEINEDYDKAIKKYKKYIYGATYCTEYAQCADIDHSKRGSTCNISSFPLILNYLENRGVYVVQNKLLKKCGVDTIKKILIRINENYNVVTRIVLKYNRICELFKFFDFTTNSNIKNILFAFIEEHNNNININNLEKLANELGENFIICCSSSIRQFYDLYHDCIVFTHNVHLFWYINKIGSDIAQVFKIDLDQSAPTEYLFFIKVKDEYAHYFDKKVYINEYVIDTLNIRLCLPVYLHKEIFRLKDIPNQDIIAKQFNSFLMKKKCKKKIFTILYDELMSHFSDYIDRKNIRDFLSTTYNSVVVPDYKNELVYYNIGNKKRNAK